jgi:hypothetical protein
MARLGALEAKVEKLALSLATARGAYLVLVLLLGLIGPALSIVVPRVWPIEPKARASDCQPSDRVLPAVYTLSQGYGSR